MGKKDEKTNVMRLLEQKKVPYQSYCYVETGLTNGVEVANYLKQDVSHVFKTLVTIAPKSKINYVFVIPVAEELDLKKAAKAVNEKAIEMIKQKDLLPLTGYIHGGCSPIGMKKTFMTTLHSSAEELDTFCVSGGRVGYQVKIHPEDLKKLIRIQYADIIV